MRSDTFGCFEEVYSEFTKEQALEMFKKVCDIKAFEENVRDAYSKGKVKCPVYLSLGKETIPAALSMTYKNPSIFAQHRAHGLYLAYGGNLENIVDELLHKRTGCAKGMGGSASIHSPEIKMFGHDGLMGSQIPIAVGYALAHKGKENTLAVMGDASAEEDYVLGAIGYASHKNLPVLFVCEDNNLSILTKVNVRRNWKMTDIARAFGIKNAVDITDDPWLIMHYASKFKDNLPAFMNIYTARDVWHAGSGSDGPPEWNRFDITKKRMEYLGLGREAGEIEENSREYITKFWSNKLEEF